MEQEMILVWLFAPVNPIMFVVPHAKMKVAEKGGCHRLDPSLTHSWAPYHCFPGTFLLIQSNIKTYCWYIVCVIMNGCGPNVQTRARRLLCYSSDLLQVCMDLSTFNVVEKLTVLEWISHLSAFRNILFSKRQRKHALQCQNNPILQVIFKKDAVLKETEKLGLVDSSNYIETRLTKGLCCSIAHRAIDVRRGP